MIPSFSHPQTTTHISTTSNTTPTINNTTPSTTISDQVHHQNQPTPQHLFYMSQNNINSNNNNSTTTTTINQQHQHQHFNNINNGNNPNITSNFLSNNNNNRTATVSMDNTNSNIKEEMNYCYFYEIREECLEVLEEEARRKAREMKMSTKFDGQSNQLIRRIINTNAAVVTQPLTQHNQNSVMKPVIVERHGILPLSNQDSNTTLGKLKNYTNSNRGIMITTHTTSEPLSTSPHYPITQHDLSVVQNLQLSNNQNMIFQPPNQQLFQTHVSNNANITTNTTKSDASLTNSRVNSSNSPLQVFGSINVSNNSNAQILNVAQQDQDLLKQLFDEEEKEKNIEIDDLLAVDMDDSEEFLKSPTLNNLFYNNTSNNNNNNMASSSSIDNSMPPTINTNLFESKQKKKKRSKSSVIHVEIPPPLLAPNQPNLNSPQNNSIGGSASTINGSATTTNNKRKAKTGKKKRKQSVASSSSMPSSSNSTNTNDQPFFFGNMNMLPMFPITGEEGAGPDEESNAPPRRKRGRPPTVHTWSFGIGENTYNTFTRFSTPLEPANTVNNNSSNSSSSSSNSDSESKSNKKKKTKKKSNNK